MTKNKPGTRRGAGRHAPLLAAALLAGLAGCSRQQATPAAPAAARASAAAAPALVPAAAASLIPATAATADAAARAPLMKAVFGAAYSAQQDEAIADLPDPDHPGRLLHTVLQAVDIQRLPSGDTVLVAAGQHANADGVADSSHADGGYLSLYLLRQQGGLWTLLRRHDNVANLGSSGSMGELRWIELAAGKPGIAVLHGGVWQGYAITLLSLFDPAAERVRDLSGALPVQSDNEGACGPAVPMCWRAEAAWHFQPAAAPGEYDDLVLTFSGEQRTARGAPAAAQQADGAERDGERDVERETRPFKGTARYVYQRGAYRLRDGVNPVPTI